MPPQKLELKNSLFGGVFCLKKYSDEVKFTVVQEYLNGTLGYSSLTTKYGISDKNLIQTWVNN